MRWLRARLATDPAGQRHVEVYDQDGRVVAAATPDAALQLAADLLDAVNADRLSGFRDQDEKRDQGELG